MRVALVVAILVAIFLAFILIIKATNKAADRRKEQRAIAAENYKLRNMLAIISGEVELQEQAGYSDVTAFRHHLNTHKEILP